MLPFEFVVRGYLFGSMWESYKRGESFCGVTLREGYKLAQKLKQPVCTPALKHDRGHDEYVGIWEVENKLGLDRTKQIIKYCLSFMKRVVNMRFHGDGLLLMPSLSLDRVKKEN